MALGIQVWRKEKLMSLGKYPDVPLALAEERHAEARKAAGDRH